MRKIDLMNKIIVIVLLLLASCSSNQDNSAVDNSDDNDVAFPSTFFNGSLDGEQMTGDGITLIQQADSSLRIMGFWGMANSYYRVDFLVNESDDGTYRLGANGVSGTISEIVGGDAVGRVYSASGAESDTVSFVWDKEAERIAGNFVFTAVGDSSSLTVSGDFNSSIRESEGNAWTCNFEDELINRCWFITTDGQTQSLAMSDGTEISSESLKCGFWQSIGSMGVDDQLFLSLQYLSGPNAVAFSLALDNPIPATPFSAIAGQQGMFTFFAYTSDVGYRDTLANSEIELQLASLPLPSDLSDGDIVPLEGRILVNEFSLIERPASGIAGTRQLLLATQTLDVDCEAQYQEAELVF